MEFALDTQAWIWSVFDDPRLSRRARKALAAASARGTVGLPAICLREAAWHLAHGRIEIAAGLRPWPVWLRRASSLPQLEILPLSVDVAVESEHIPEPFPRDPADRLIAATARVHGLTLITADRQIRKSGRVRTLW